MIAKRLKDLVEAAKAEKANAADRAGKHQAIAHFKQAALALLDRADNTTDEQKIAAFDKIRTEMIECVRQAVDGDMGYWSDDAPSYAFETVIMASLGRTIFEATNGLEDLYRVR